jgi:2-methylcitrate dehydratase PrpD
VSEPALAARLAEWVGALTFSDLPGDVVASTKLRVLDVIGLALAGSETQFGQSVRTSSVLSPHGPSRILGSGEKVAPTTAAFANASFAQALEFDDTHNESIVHMSSPAVTASLAMAEARRVSGRELIVAIALANEISSRVGSVASGQFHRRGFHPTGLFAPFGVTYLAGRLLGSDPATLARAAGICGSTAAGLLECWVDGTQSKFLHSGFAAQNGIHAATLAHAGVTGPPTIFEGRFGLFASHLQHPDTKKDFSRITEGLGDRWDSRNASFKPYPAAHVLHPYVDALLRAREQHGIAPAQVARIECPVAEFNVSIVCEPLAEKLAPASDSHARISLPYTMAEALYVGRLGKTAYSAANLRNPEILALARRVSYRVDPMFPGPGRFKGAVRIVLTDGREISETQEHNLGSAENPMTPAQLRAKFDENASGVLSEPERTRLAEEIDRLDGLDDAAALVDLTIPAVLSGSR